MQGRFAVNSSVCQPGLIGIKALKPYAKSDRISQVLESTNFCPLLILRSFKWTLGKKTEGVLCAGMYRRIISYSFDEILSIQS